MSDLDKIDKILRLYENNPDQAEADAALKKSAELMRNYIDSKQTNSTQASPVSPPEPTKDTKCSGCGEEKPSHKEGCFIAKVERRMGWGGILGCFSCAGLLFIGFLSACVSLFHQLFG
jgi:Protein of unknown function (DUF2786)